RGARPPGRRAARGGRGRGAGGGRRDEGALADAALEEALDGKLAVDLLHEPARHAPVACGLAAGGETLAGPEGAVEQGAAQRPVEVAAAARRDRRQQGSSGSTHDGPFHRTESALVIGPFERQDRAMTLALLAVLHMIA